MSYTEARNRIFDNLTSAVLLFDEALRLVCLNPSAEMLLEISERKAQGRHAMDLFLYAPDLEGVMQRAFRIWQPFTEREMLLDLGPERRITVDLTITPVSEKGLAQGLLMEIQQVDRHLRISREEHILVQQQATRALLRGMAHEIKNPLGGLRGAAQLLERELPDENLKEFTSIIIGEADRLQNLMDRMLGPNQRPHKQSINMLEILERVRSLMLAEFPEKLVIRRDYDPSIPEIEADPDQLIQSLLNIVGNAAQALQGEGEITLCTRVQRYFTIGHIQHRLVMRVSVIDDGPGIPPEIMDKLFFPMVTGRSDGTGLGLSIAQSLINQHGGLVECNSRSGRTEFTIWLPLENRDE